MESIRAAARVGIDQRCLQFVLAEKPTERAYRPCRPLRAAIRPPCGKAGGKHCRGFEGLLVKGFGSLSGPAKAHGANRSEISRGCGLQRHQPTQRPQADLDVWWRLSRQ